jgi:hypothetical protein
MMEQKPNSGKLCPRLVLEPDAPPARLAARLGPLILLWKAPHHEGGLTMPRYLVERTFPDELHIPTNSVCATAIDGTVRQCG